MTTLQQYLDSIAEAVLKPVGKYYWKTGDTDSTISYAGLHPSNRNNKLWEEWAELTTVMYEDVVYCLMWTCQDDGMQGSWWVKVVNI